MTPGGSFGLSESIFGGDGIGDGDGVAGGLARDVEQHRGLAVRRDRGVDRHGRRLDGGDVGDADGRAAGGGLDDQLAELVGVVRLRADEAEDELMIGFVQAGRIDDVGSLNGIDEIEEGDAGGLQPGEIGDDVELGHLAALHDDGADAGDAIQRRLQVVGGDLPEPRLRDGVFAAVVGGERVAEDGKGGEGEAVGGDAGGGGQRLLHLGERRIDELQRAEHVHVPVEEEADLGRSAAGGGAHGQQAGNAVDGVFDGLGDGDLHLLDRHDAVVDADDDARKVGLGKDGDRHLKGGVDAGEGEDDEEEEDGLGGAREPERFVRVPVCCVGTRSSVVTALVFGCGLSRQSALPIFTLVPSSRP